MSKPSARRALTGSKVQPDLHSLIDRAQRGDQTATAPLRRLFDDNPNLWRQAGDMALQAERAMIERAAGANVVFREAMQRKLAELRDEIVGPNSSPLERLLAERIAICWLDVYETDCRCSGAVAKALTLEQLEYLQRRLDRAQKRYLSAIRTLAQIRKLLTPAVQVNIADRQVNITS